ncbi:ribosome maturation factor RimM [Aliidiomarina sanyensis]|uniref:Ribosome maturation factor RimM n=1 Tax=Aliidiomarina sanyensis TaxID=1249555 RepID=A0A432WNF6_9GAMM|nr:ribosome maturation factor RimM [Aliidiomarina sanyensis]RUO35281.1 ribosome maturation factor RimM [Aliidiomarina sanyensis]
MTDSQQHSPVVLGTIGAVYGIKGWLRINAYTENQEGIFDYSPWLIGHNGQWREAKVSQWRWHNNGLVAKFAEVDDRDAAQQLTGLEIAVPADALPELAEDEFYWRDLVGLRVVNKENYDMGIVNHLMPTVANDVLVVNANSNDAFGKRERLIPFIQSQYIVKVDKEAGLITVDWPADF